jgi:GAF domain-containing protein
MPVPPNKAIDTKWKGRGMRDGIQQARNVSRPPFMPSLTLPRSVIVADVHNEPGHIACDANTQAEIVVPLFLSGKLAGVLDLDSESKSFSF